MHRATTHIQSMDQEWHVADRRPSTKQAALNAPRSCVLPCRGVQGRRRGWVQPLKVTLASRQTCQQTHDVARRYLLIYSNLIQSNLVEQDQIKSDRIKRNQTESHETHAVTRSHLYSPAAFAQGDQGCASRLPGPVRPDGLEAEEEGVHGALSARLGRERVSRVSA